jgi:hypothetical protein
MKSKSKNQPYLKINSKNTSKNNAYWSKNHLKIGLAIASKANKTGPKVPIRLKMTWPVHPKII